MVVKLTVRQAHAWIDDVVPTCLQHDLPIEFSHWTTHYADETRPGRGHYINAFYVDGDHCAQVLMDVYGNPTVSVAELNWVHADGDEELDCPVCEC